MCVCVSSKSSTRYHFHIVAFDHIDFDISSLNIMFFYSLLPNTEEMVHWQTAGANKECQRMHGETCNNSNNNKKRDKENDAMHADCHTFCIKDNKYENSTDVLLCAEAKSIYCVHGIQVLLAVHFVVMHSSSMNRKSTFCHIASLWAHRVKALSLPSYIPSRAQSYIFSWRGAQSLGNFLKKQLLFEVLRNMTIIFLLAELSVCFDLKWCFWHG